MEIDVMEKADLHTVLNGAIGTGYASISNGLIISSDTSRY